MTAWHFLEGQVPIDAVRCFHIEQAPFLTQTLKNDRQHVFKVRYEKLIELWHNKENLWNISAEVFRNFASQQQ